MSTGPQITQRYADLDEVRLHFVEAGTGPLVVLLHGFPEFWYAWRHQIPVLVAAGYRVVAPDLRGYNLSDKPRAVRAYQIQKVAADIAGLIKFCGAERAAVVGHDWGGAAAWVLAMQWPALVERLVILNVPHPLRFFAALGTLRQLRKSWYMFAFQLPLLPEWSIRSKHYKAIRKTLREDPVRPGAYTDADIELYVEAASQPGAVRSGLNYYRAAFRQGARRMRALVKKIDLPVLIIWGQRDIYAGPELAEPDRQWVSDYRIVRLENASHWVMADEPERVDELILEHLGEATKGTSHGQPV